MSTINSELRERAVREIVTYILMLSFGSKPAPKDILERTTESARLNLQNFLYDCRESLEKITNEKVDFNNDPVKMLQERTFWNLFVSFAHEGLIAQGKALGLSQKTATEIIVVLSKKQSN